MAGGWSSSLRVASTPRRTRAYGPSPDVTVNKTARSRQSVSDLNVQAWNNKGSTAPVGLLLVFCHGVWAIRAVVFGEAMLRVRPGVSLFEP